MTECPEIISAFHGTVVKSMNNYFLVSFEVASDAVNCSLKIQSNINNQNKKKKSIDFVIALSAGAASYRKERVKASFRDNYDRLVKLKENMILIVSLE